MTTKKKKPNRRLRLSSFERALRDAELRLAKANQERTECCQKLENLNGEIPYLEAIIHAFTPGQATTLDDAYDAVYARVRERAQARVQVPTPPPQPRAPEPDPIFADIDAVSKLPKPDLYGTENLEPADQAQFLARFMPRTGRTTALHPGPLNSAIPPVAPSPGNSDDPDEFLRDDGAGRPILD